MASEHSPATRAITSGRAQQGPASPPPLWGTSTWQSSGLDDTRKRATGMRAGEFYSRYANPTVRAFEEAVADLEGAEDALAFGSGMGAIASVVFALCSAGDHIVAQRQIYAARARSCRAVRAAWASTTPWVDGTTPGAFAEAVRPGRTMLVVAESPSNPRLDLVDLDDLGAVAGPFTMVVAGAIARAARRSVIAVSKQRPMQFGLRSRSSRSCCYWALASRLTNSVSTIRIFRHFTRASNIRSKKGASREYKEANSWDERADS